MTRTSGCGRRWRDDGGFTLVEMLVVLVILPLLIGAVAEVVIVSVRNDTSVQSRISDSLNAQLTSAYFIRDVQGATQVTTNAALFSGGQACGPSTNPGTPLVALLGPGIKAGYWLQGTGSSKTLTRFSCSGSSKTAVVMADVPQNLGGSGITAAVSISPPQIATAAQAGWALTAASTSVTAVQTIGPTLNVLGTAGFSVGSTPSGTVCASTSTQPTFGAADNCSGAAVNVMTVVGTTQVTCKGVGTTSFTLCSGGGSGSAVGSVTQSAISAVQIAVGEPTGAYHFNLVSAPRSSAGACTTPGGCAQGGGPTLLALGNTGITFNGTGSFRCTDGATAHLCITGAVLADGGVITCGSGSIDATGGVYAVNSTGSGCGSVPVKPAGFQPDYVAPKLPLCFLQNFMTARGVGTPSPATSGLLTPGIYTGSLSGAILEPGVYVLEGGVSGSLAMAPPSALDSWYQNPPGSGAANFDPNAGVLLYLPGPAPAGEPTGCIDTATSPALNLGAGGLAITLVPLDANQSATWFSGSSALTNMWVWQNRTNASSLSMGGSESITVGPPPTSSAAPSGMAYLPSATLVVSNGSPTIYTGCLLVGGINLGGTPGITLSGRC